MVRIAGAPTSFENLFYGLPRAFGFLEKEDVRVFHFDTVSKDPLFGSPIEASDVPSDDLHG
jgi:hypothetical protein